MTSDGVGLAALIAEWAAVALALVLALAMLRGMGAHIVMAAHSRPAGGCGRRWR